MSLEQLIDDCRNNDRKAQEQLYKLYKSKLFAVCLKYSRNYAEAEDNFQDGFVIIFNKIGQYNFKGSFEGWMKRIMVNNVLQQYRNVTYLDMVNKDIADEDVEVDIDDENVPLDFLMKIIQELPDRYRLVFNLYVIDGYPHKEIADMLEITIGTSKSNLARARMILKEKIDHYSNTQKLPSAK
ncbi:sigma-70 family RNA polymerase sigma factor [Flavobacterium sp. MAH-1]|uniref:Sigma-70 family RNA polymerase sigma factor n=1 Tax=Flavobacterium agri TaxID=2743471 RepID=A0A7Y8Y092_9FLAO|nr:sigma-70 family RNA polymerase sigma factor [Flavobacterium agri]NUY80184.1 sigma-70 family RNA polymerase sigma factor [Flavobacterium agri]NYA70209.1 sigma-70 family RNA polymerase sigma factor [Flavobacterium agri]